MASMPRVQKILLPILRGDPRLDGVHISTWVPDIDYRQLPIVNVRRIGGIRNPDLPTLHASPVIELTVYHDVDLIAAENLYETVLDVLYDAVKYQTTTDHGSLQSIFETMGATQFSSSYMDSWRVQGLIRCSVRAPRT